MAAYLSPSAYICPGHVQTTRCGVPGQAYRTRSYPDQAAVALAQISAPVAAGVPPATVLADAGYGIDTAFRDGINVIGLTYVPGIQYLERA